MSASSSRWETDEQNEGQAEQMGDDDDEGGAVRRAAAARTTKRKKAKRRRLKTSVGPFKAVMASSRNPFKGPKGTVAARSTLLPRFDLLRHRRSVPSYVC